MPSPDPTFVYRFFDAADRLVYVGITCEPAARWKNHARYKQWWADVVRIEAILYPCRHAALDEELRVIREESPLRNIKDAVAALKERQVQMKVAPAPAPQKPDLDEIGREFEDFMRGRGHITTSEAARLFEVKTTTIANWRSKGWLPAWQTPTTSGRGPYRFGRVPLERLYRAMRLQDYSEIDMMP